jgi:predicted nucleotidyltransferase
VRDLAPNESAAIQRLKDGLARDFRLVELRLFGSKARGDSNPESDIDVLIVLEEFDWETEKAVSHLCFEINIEYGVLLVPVLYSRAEYESDLTKVTPFYQNVRKEGVLV